MMKRMIPRAVPALLVFLALVARAENKPALYDANANGTDQIASALVTAKKENKRVILQFGANWCVWCHALHKFVSADAEIAEFMGKNYVVVLIDVDKGRNLATIKQYRYPTRFGVPVLVFLDAEGVQLATVDTEEIEKGESYDQAKVMTLLKKWAPGSTTPPDKYEMPEYLIPVDVKALEAKALEQILKLKPEIKAEDLTVSGLTYRLNPDPDYAIYQQEDGSETRIPLGPNYQELVISYVVESSERKEQQEGRTVKVKDTLNLNFPNARSKEFSINEGTQTSY